MCVCEAVMSPVASSSDINSSSSSSASVVRPSWLAAGCGLVLDPMLAMKLVATHDAGLRTVNMATVNALSSVAVSASDRVSTSHDATTSSFLPATSSSVPAAVLSETLST